MFATLYRYPHPYDATKFIYCGQESNPKHPRDKNHRSGKSPFGRRFKRTFPGVDLPQPIKEAVKVQDQLELNELETIWIFQYHTWRGYDGGMNLTLPGSQDYKNMGLIGGSISGRITGPIQGRKNVESGHIQNLGKSGIGGRAVIVMRKERGDFENEEHRKRASKVAAMRKKRGDFQSEEHRKRASEGDRIGMAVRKERGDFQSEEHRKVSSEGGHVGGRIGGRISGRKNVESGHLFRISCLRWNIRRNKPCVCGTHEQKIAA